MPSSAKDQDLFGLINDSEDENNVSLDEEEEKDTRFSKSKLQKSSFNDSDASSDESEDEDDKEDRNEEEESELENEEDNRESEESEEESEEEIQEELSDMEGYDAPTDLTEFGVMSSKKGKEKKKKIKSLTPEELEKFEKARKKTGVCYLSRIPLFMPPSRVRELLKKYADIGRIYLVPEGRR